jgi:uncharacterized protein (DUF885 family)
VRRTALVSAFLFTTACGGNTTSTPVNTTDGGGRSGDDALRTTLKTYVVEFLRRNPTVNTYLGGAGLDPSLREVDGMLRDHSVAALVKEDQWLGEISKAVETIPSTSLSENGRIDREVALAQIRFQLHQHQVRRYQERAVDTYIGDPFRALDWQLQGMTQTGAKTYGTADEWALVINRVNQIPRFLDAAREQLVAGVKANNVADRRMLQRDGLMTSEANAKYFAETLPKLAADRMSGPRREEALASLRTAGKAASDAYLAMGEFLAVTFFDDATRGKVKPTHAADRFAMGEEEYNWAITNNFKLEKTAAQLYEDAWPIVQATQQQMIDLAREIGAQHKWQLPPDGRASVRTVFDQLSKDYPKSDTEMVAWYRDTAFRLVEYARKTGLFDVPADYKLDVVETPPPLQSSIDGAAYYPAPPFKNSGVGRFYVTPTHNDRAALQSNNRAALADLAAHEGFPGHDWYYKVLTQFRDQVSPVRWLTPGAVEDSSSMWEDSASAEGWGLYAEALMAEPQPGAPNGFYTPEERLYQLQGKLYRDLRVRIDTGIHTGRMTYDEAVSLFSEIVDFLPGPCSGTATAKQSDAKRASCADAERAIFRYSKWPTQAITYRLGKDQIYALREDAAKKAGSTFSTKTFHLLFIRQGTIPPGYFRDVLLGQIQQAR